MSDPWPPVLEPSPLSPDPHWYQQAIFYELSVRAFQDSNDDGIGDFAGLESRLDYLLWLGVTCLWLMPFNQSPLRDGGYDVSDYYQVHPDYGNIDAVRQFVAAAHQRGIRVIMDLPINHTSDQHPWFQAARTGLENPYHDWYLWSDTSHKFQLARPLFPDREMSNWTWDETAGSYYFHRGFKYQPDLNFDNPQVRQAILDICRFWLGLGMDGFRLDGLPYLFAREGTDCENLPEAHHFVNQLRAQIDQEYAGRVLIGDAKQALDQQLNYFGDAANPECQICFDYPLMPRLFLALQKEHRQPVSHLLHRAPMIPPGCQWGLFLRNHDELIMDGLSPEEKTYLWGELAAEPRMQLNFGIRRRLAPLLDNGRHRIELFYGLLLSLPGSPILYYGDEIGMGDNIYLGDRDGVRTPMQWDQNRNGGFSGADFASLYLPPQLDPVYGFAACNVASQQRNQTSLLAGVRRLLKIRREHPIFGQGELILLSPGNNAVLAYLRSWQGKVALCVNNLSKYAQPVELNLSQYQGLIPVEMLGRVHFPAIGELPYLLTLSSHGFYWFDLESGA